MKKFFSIILAVIFFATPIAAQQNSRCLLDGARWSDGSAVGGKVCSNGSWADIGSDGASFCLYKDEIYSPGARIKVEGDIALICQANGHWIEPNP